MASEHFDFETLSCKIINEARKLLSYQKADSFFASDMSKEELEKFKDAYFDMINHIEASRKIFYADISKLSQSILRIDKQLASLSTRYSDFLPYKAALFESHIYINEIYRIDTEFKASISKAESDLNNNQSRLNTLVLICDTVIPDFYRKASLYSGAPKFKSFNSAEFFGSINAFIYQMNTIQKQKPM